MQKKPCDKVTSGRDEKGEGKGPESKSGLTVRWRPEGNNTKPTNPHEAFDSAWFVYKNLWIPDEKHWTRPDAIVINPRSMTGEGAAGGVDTTILRSNTLAYGLGALGFGGAIDVLPFIGNRDPNPHKPGNGGNSGGFSPALIAALSLRDPMPIQ